MATGCPAIALERIRAEVQIGSLTVATPYVKSFSIQRSRGNAIATCSVSIEVPVSTSLDPGEDIKVDRIVDGIRARRFTGEIDSVDVDPSFDKANYYVLNIQASDSMKRLENRKFSRRLQSDGMSVFAAITSVTHQPNTQRGVTIEKKIVEGEHEIMWPNMMFGGDNSLVVKAPNWTSSTKETDKLPRVTGAKSDRDLVSASLIEYDIIPRVAIVGEGETQTFSINPTSEYNAGSWSVSDDSLGSIVDNEDGTIVYTQTGAGTVTITYTDVSGYTGITTAMTMPPHTHEDMSQGGPAWGVMKTE